MNKLKYIVVDEPKRGLTGDMYQEIYDTPEGANTAASYNWDHLTRREQKCRHIFAGIVTPEDLPEDAFDEDTGKIDWAAANNIQEFPGAFDSDKWGGGDKEASEP